MVKSTATVSTAGLIDGGPYKCGNGHEVEFITADPSEWSEHLDSHKQDSTIKFGHKACPVCGETVTYSNVPLGLNPVHPECLQKLSGGSAQ